jgi:hypothetical protein
MDLLARFIREVRSVDPEATARDVADMLWLAGHLKGVSPSWLKNVEDDKGADRFDKDGAMPDGIPTESDDAPGEEKSRPPAAEGGLHAATGPAGEGESGGLPFPAPTLPALPGRAELHRALRPLKRRVNSRVRTTTDIRATADFIAETGIPCPVLRPQKERWLDVVLVVEESPSMAVWRRTVRELYQVLVRAGIFRDVRIWRFARAPDRPALQLHEGFSGPMPQGPGRHPSALIHPDGRRLILLVSDAVSRAWHEGLVYRMADHWKKGAITALVQMMPYWLWERTGLDRAISARLLAGGPGDANHRLRIAGPRRVLRALAPKKKDGGGAVPRSWQAFGDSDLTRLLLPVVMLSSDFLGPLVDSISGRRYHRLPGVVYDQARFPAVPPPVKVGSEGPGPEKQKPGPSPDPDPDPEALVRGFRSTASHPARRQASFLAAAPLVLPVMRAVQGKMLPESRQYHLAEVMLSGMVRRESPREKWLPSDEIWYEFFPGVRERLLTESRRDETLNVLTLVDYELSAFVNEAGARESFQAVLAGGLGPGEGPLRIAHERFARVAAFVLRRLGGRYARVAVWLDRELKKLGEDGVTVAETTDETDEGRAGTEKANRPRYELRKTPMTVSDDEFKKVFRLDKNGRPLEYVQNDYHDNSDGTVTDRATGLTWQMSGSPKFIPYKERQKYIDQINRDRFAGYSDWRLPTVDELTSLLEPEKKGELYIDPIFDDKQWWCWSADERASGGAWRVFFNLGVVHWNFLDLALYVRAVRP